MQAFFDSTKIHIRVVESSHRLTSITDFSTPAHSFYSINIPFTENSILRKKMTQFSHNYVRVGRML